MKIFHFPNHNIASYSLYATEQVSDLSGGYGSLDHQTSCNFPAGWLNVLIGWSSIVSLKVWSKEPIFHSSTEN